MDRETRIQQGPPTQLVFETLVDEIAETRRQKVLAYGEERYQDDDFWHAMNLTYSDILRKFIRIKECVTNRKATAEDGETLREAFKDIAVYGLMGMQLYDQLHFQVIESMQAVRIDQIAFSTKDPEYTKRILEAIFGDKLTWHSDTVVAKGQVFDVHNQTNVAQLNFNYQIGPCEFELLHYQEGSNWIQGQRAPGLSHLGIHVDDVAPWMDKMDELGFRVAQSVVTQSHTNPAIKDKRRYRYTIFDTHRAIGFDLKFIERLQLDENGFAPGEEAALVS